MDLNERKMRILKAIVDEYIEKGEPVGSKHLVEYGKISLSPATIRNEMSDLEQMGYLDKPHTSAGRIPSNAAYRIYVEQLMENYRLNLQELELLNELTAFKMGQLDEMVARAGRVMSQITHCASLAMTTTQKKYSVKRFDVLGIDEYSFLLVMILPDDSVKTVHVKTSVRINQEAVVVIKQALNKYLQNVSLDSVSIPTILELERAFGKYSLLVNTVVGHAYNAVCGQDKNTSVNIEGITNLLSYPEFTDIGKVKSLLSLFESRKDEIVRVLQSGDDNEKANLENSKHKLQIYIGNENQMTELSDTSVLFCSFPVGNNTNAVLGILGPKRMDYRRAVSALRQLADNLESFVDGKDITS